MCWTALTSHSDASPLEKKTNEANVPNLDTISSPLTEIAQSLEIFHASPRTPRPRTPQHTEQNQARIHTLETRLEKSQDQLSALIKENTALSRQVAMYKRLASTTHEHCEFFEPSTFNQGISASKVSELATDLLCEYKTVEQVVAAMLDLVDRAGGGLPINTREQMHPLGRLGTVEEVMDITLDRFGQLEQTVKRLKDKDDKFVNEEDLIEGGDEEEGGAR